MINTKPIFAYLADKRYVTVLGLLILFCVNTSQAQNKTAKNNTKFVITGYVYDQDKLPIENVSIVEKENPTNGVVSQKDGRFELTVLSPMSSIIVSHMGYLKKSIEINRHANFNIFLQQDVNQIEPTIVTGYYPKAKNSFTGTAVAVKGDQLRMVNNTNFLEALKVFDASFQIIDPRGMFGSDPNHLPQQIEIRGQNSFPEISGSNLKTITSMPIFMLDGFEITIQQVNDLDMNRIQSVTILKDASASAIYGSRAANGVVVIESRMPQPGALRISYSLTGGVSIPDLSSYNLMNSAEALEFQRLAGIFNARNTGEDAGAWMNSYNVIRKEIMSGVDTYWLSKPLRVGLQHRHSLMIEGSVNRFRANEGNVRYQVNLSVGSNDGVMKNSNRTSYGGGTKLVYSRAGLRMTNDLQFNITKSKESPYGSFSSYTKALPYHRERDAQGDYYRTLTLKNVAPEAMSLGVTMSQLSPVYEAKYLSSFDVGDITNISNTTAVEWAITGDLRIRGDFSVSNSRNRADAYLSPMSYSYIEDSNNDTNNPSVLYDRGRYKLSHSRSTSLNGKTVISYSKQFNRHYLQTIAGAEMRESQNKGDAYVVTGFMDDAMGNISHATRYEMYARPEGSESTVRTAGVFSNINYSFDNRYLIDVTARLDGSSLYGRNQRTAPYWSTGIRWNLHNEKFFGTNLPFKTLALRANIGTTGNQNFALNQAMSLYTFLKPTYGNMFGTTISKLGNPDLECQETFNRNIGIELSTANGLLNLDFNYYYNTTKGSVTDVTIAPSIGFSQLKVNQGDIVNRGVDFRLAITPIRTQDWTLTFNINGRHNENTLSKISNTLKKYNEMVGQQAEKENSLNVFLFEEGQSMNTIYAVRSLGIDPGTGREHFLDKNGNRSDVWSAADLVPVGVAESIIDGYAGFNLRYRDWELGADFNYSIGADKYNYTLNEKIEGISYTTNNDRRALTDRWTTPGKAALYKALGDDSPTRPTSRFVQHENRLSLSSLRASYTLPVEKLGFKSISLLRLSVTANDIFYLSTIKQERGLQYPYARSVNFALNLNF